MGQKTIPTGLRISLNKDWDAKWFWEGKDCKDLLKSDLEIRAFLAKKLSHGHVARIVVERHKTPKVTVYSGRPGLIIGKKGVGLEALKKDLIKKFGFEIPFNIVEVRKPDMEASLIAQDIARQMEKRIPCKRAMKKAAQAAQSAGAKGVKIICSGRLGGAEIARSEGILRGSVPAHTLKADIRYGRAEANTSYGKCGIKVFIHRGNTVEGSFKKDGHKPATILPSAL